MSIKWANVDFDGPYSIKYWQVPCKAGIYAIMKKSDPQNNPNTYTILYFGESGNLSERGFVESHHKYYRWIKEADSEHNLYIGTYLMPNSSSEERRQIENQLIFACKPICNN